MERKVVIDSSPLIGLVLVGGLEWLPSLFSNVYLPETVRQEVLPGKMHPANPLFSKRLRKTG
jgi:predicted nucleic acid-binding protein